MLLQLRLTPDQNDEKQAAELAVKEAQDELEAETETEKKDALKKEIAERQEKLTTLVAGFEVISGPQRASVFSVPLQSLWIAKNTSQAKHLAIQTSFK